MRLVKLGLASLNPSVGALDDNIELVTDAAAAMAGDGCTVGVFTEQVLSGYPIEDLVQWHGFVDRQWGGLERFAAATKKLSYPTIFTLGLTVGDAGNLYNAVAVVAAGKILGIVPKETLPTYDVFYERRVFSRGIPGEVRAVRGVPFGDVVFRAPFGIMAVEVCEDMWVANGPILRRSVAGAELVVNVSASPWRTGVVGTRKEIIATRAAENQVTFVYVNQVGGQDSLVFDGGAWVNQNGRMLYEAERWKPGWTSYVVDLDRTRRLRAQGTSWRETAEVYSSSSSLPRAATVEVDVPEGKRVPLTLPKPSGKRFFGPGPAPELSPDEIWYEDLIAAMKTGLGGYFEKTGVFTRLGIALSGGKDSALTLLVAWLYAQDRFESLGERKRAARIRDFIQCFSMPTRFSSETTRSIARRLAEDLGVGFKEVSIEEAFDVETRAAEAMLDKGEELPEVTLQNIQARIRAQRMWNWSNATGGMWLQSGNMSEKAVGYTTVGGDLMGAYSLLGNLPKTIVIRLVEYLHDKHRFPSLTDLLETKASAELARDQEDERDLMPFPVLDACFALFAEEKLMPAELYLAIRSMWTDEELTAMRPDYEPGILKEWVKRFCRLFIGSIFKWVQAPQAVHLGTLDLDRERALQLPAVQSQQWLDLDAIDDLPD